MSQLTKIKRHLEAGNKISPLQALRDYGCMRLADVIYRLRRKGMIIDSETRKQGDKRYAVYRLRQETE